MKINNINFEIRDFGDTHGMVYAQDTNRDKLEIAASQLESRIEEITSTEITFVPPTSRIRKGQEIQMGNYYKLVAKF